MSDPDPFGDLMRSRGATPQPVAPLQGPQVSKAEGDAAVSQAKGEIAPRREKAETVQSEASGRKTNAQAVAAEFSNEQKMGEGAQRAYLTSRMQDIEGTGVLFQNIQNARNLIGKLSTGPGGQLTQGLWGTPASDLGAALEAVASKEVIGAIMRMKAASATGATGFGQLSDREGTYLASQLGSLKQRQSPEQLMRTLNNIELSYRKFLAYSSGIDPSTPEGAYWAGLAKPGEDQPGEVPVSPDGQYKWEPDPTLRGVNNTVIDMIKAGRSEAQIKEWLNGINPELGRATDIQTNIDLWKAGGEPRVKIEGKWVPKGAVADVLGKASDTPLGAYAMGAGDVLSAGTLDELTSDPNLARAGMQQAREEHPTATTVGQLTGGALSAIGGEGLLARGGIRVAPWLGDLAFGSAYGAGSADDAHSRLGGAMMGGATGLAGGAVMRGGTQAVGAGLRGVQDKSAQLLAKYDIPMTVGQMLPGKVRGWEEKAMSWPGIGGMIRARRGESLEGFNKAAFDEALAPIGASTDGAIGQQGVATAQQHVTNAYNGALDGTQIVFDQGFANDLAKAMSHNVHKVPTIGPEVDGELQRILSTYVGDGTQPISGAHFQAARQELRGLRSSYTKVPNFKGVKPAIDAAEDALTNAFERQNPGQLPKYLAADEAYKRVSIIGDAVDMSQANQGGVFNPATLRQQVRTNTRKFSGRMASQSGRRPFNDLTLHGSTTLPSTLPNSGTADRLMLPLTLGALTSGGSYLSSGETRVDRNGHEQTVNRDIPGSLILGGLAGLAAATPYSRSGQRAAQWLLTGPRNQSAITMGELMSRYANVAGRGAAGASADALLDRTPNPDVSQEVLVNDAIIQRALKAQRELAGKEGPQAIAAQLGFPQLEDDQIYLNEGPQLGDEVP